jgi:hypothetical protein
MWVIVLLVLSHNIFFLHSWLHLNKSFIFCFPDHSEKSKVNVKLEVTKRKEEDEEDEGEDEDDEEGDDEESESGDESDESSSEEDNDSEDEHKTDAERRREKALTRIQVCCFYSDIPLGTCRIDSDIIPSPNKRLATEFMFTLISGSYKIASGLVASYKLLCTPSIVKISMLI